MDQYGTRKKVLCPLENDKTGKTYWLRIGSAFVNRDGSTNVYLDALPANRKLHIRDIDENDDRKSRDGGGQAGEANDGGSQNGLPF